MQYRSSILALVGALSLGTAAHADTVTLNFDAATVSSSAVAFNGSTDANGLLTNSGVTLKGLSDTSVYDLSVTFSLADVSAWRKVVDFQATTADVGLYIHDGHLSAYLWHQFTPSVAESIEGSSTVANGEVFTVSLSRAATGVVSAYLNGVEQFSFNDLYGDAVFTTVNGKSVIHLLEDDYISRTEQGVATIKSITLTSEGTNAAALSTSPVPEPESLALAAAGLLTVVGLGSRRQNRN